MLLGNQMNTLLESLVTGEFRFGFELEAYAKGLEDNYALEDYFDFDDYKDKYTPNDKFKKALIKYFSKWFGNKLEIQMDESLKSHVSSFEFAVPKMALTPLNIKKCIECLSDLKGSEFNIITDNTCGFHVHFSFPTITKEDMAWIVCHIAFNQSLQKLLKFFTTKNLQTFKFFNPKYAKVGFLKDIKTNITSNNWDKLNELLSNDKMRLIRIHPDDNLEWRGPRDFLNTDDINTIKEFFIQFYTIISEIIKIMDMKEINGISRQNFFKLINLENINSNSSQNKEYKKYQDISEHIKENPLLLTKFTNDVKMDWGHIIYNLYLIKGSNFFTPLRYKTFKNKDILLSIVQRVPMMVNYINNDFKEFLKSDNVIDLLNSGQEFTPNTLIELLSILDDRTLYQIITNERIIQNNDKAFSNNTVKSYILKRFQNKSSEEKRFIVNCLSKKSTQ